MSKKRKQLSDAEIWDDSALIDSWNEALAEYKYYHSLHARGERVEDVLRDADAAEAAENAVQRGANEFADGEEDGELEDGEVDDAEDGEVYEDGEMKDDYEGHDETYDQEDEGAQNGYGGRHEQQASNGTGSRQPIIGPQMPTAPTMPPLAQLPQAVLGSGQDEAMKNIMMSWYYAGYYTGFYEGQKQGAEAVSMSAESGRGKQQGKEEV